MNCTFYKYCRLHRTNFTYACMTEDLCVPRGLFGTCNVFHLAHQFTVKYSSDFNFSDAAWRLVMQHAGVCYPSESRAESTKEKASTGYILLASHTAWLRLQLGWGVPVQFIMAVIAIRRIMKIQKVEMLRWCCFQTRNKFKFLSILIIVSDFTSPDTASVSLWHPQQVKWFLRTSVTSASLQILVLAGGNDKCHFNYGEDIGMNWHENAGFLYVSVARRVARSIRHHDGRRHAAAEPWWPQHLAQFKEALPRLLCIYEQNATAGAAVWHRTPCLQQRNQGSQSGAGIL